MNNEARKILEATRPVAIARVNERKRKEAEKGENLRKLLEEGNENGIALVRTLFASAIAKYIFEPHIERDSAAKNVRSKHKEDFNDISSSKKLVLDSPDYATGQLAEAYNSCFSSFDVDKKIYFVKLEKENGDKSIKPIIIDKEKLMQTGAFKSVSISSTGMEIATTHQIIRELAEKAQKGELTDSFFNEKLVVMLGAAYEATQETEKELDEFLNILRTNAEIVFTEICRRLKTEYEKTEPEVNFVYVSISKFLSRPTGILGAFPGRISEMIKIYERSNLSDAEDICYCCIPDAEENLQYYPILLSNLKELLAELKEFGYIGIDFDVSRFNMTLEFSISKFEQALANEEVEKDPQKTIGTIES